MSLNGPAPVNDLPVVSQDFAKERLLEYLDQDEGVHGHMSVPATTLRDATARLAFVTNRESSIGDANRRGEALVSPSMDHHRSQLGASHWGAKSLQKYCNDTSLLWLGSTDQLLARCSLAVWR
jgi:hypothetical protein